MIFSQPSISGFHFNNHSHVINPFVDDVILILTQPRGSLPNTHQMLNLFSSISYYKVNFIKSLILTLGVPKPTRDYLTLHLPYSWEDTGIPYLDIQLIPSLISW